MSGSQKRDPRGAGKSEDSGTDAPSEKRGRRQRASDVGRALRTVYDDTLREAVPDEFTDLLGKLS